MSTVKRYSSNDAGAPQINMALQAIASTVVDKSADVPSGVSLTAVSACVTQAFLSTTPTRTYGTANTRRDPHLVGVSSPPVSSAVAISTSGVFKSTGGTEVGDVLPIAKLYSGSYYVPLADQRCGPEAVVLDDESILVAGAKDTGSAAIGFHTAAKGIANICSRLIKSGSEYYQRESTDLTFASARYKHVAVQLDAENRFHLILGGASRDEMDVAAYQSATQGYILDTKTLTKHPVPQENLHSNMAIARVGDLIVTTGGSSGSDADTTTGVSSGRLYRIDRSTEVPTIVFLSSFTTHSHSSGSLIAMSDTELYATGGIASGSGVNYNYRITIDLSGGVQSATATATAVASRPTSSGRHAVVKIDSDRFMSIGGAASSAENTSNDACHIYTVSTGSWATVANIPTKLSRTRALLIAPGKILVVGGVEYSTGSESTKCYLYDVAGNTWTEKASMSIGRAYHTITLLPSGEIFAQGGASFCSGEGSTWTVYNVDLDTWSAPKPATMSNNQFSTALLGWGNKVFITGGRGYSTTYGIPGIRIYDPVSNKYYGYQHMLGQRSTPGLAKLPNGSVLVTGGSDRANGSTSYQSSRNFCEVYDPTSQLFYFDQDRPTYCRYNHGTAVLQDGRVVVFGGDSESNQAGNTAEIYDPVLRTWSLTPNLSMTRKSIPSSYVGMYSLNLPNGKLAIGGGYQSTSSSSSAGVLEFYDPTSNQWTTSSASPVIPYSDGQSGSYRSYVAGLFLKDADTIVVLFGSNQNVFGIAFAEYTISTNSWTLVGYGYGSNTYSFFNAGTPTTVKIEKLPGFTAFQLGSKIYLVGNDLFTGTNTIGTTLRVMVYDCSTKSISYLDKCLPRTFHMPTAVKTSDSTAILVGGLGLSQAAIATPYDPSGSMLRYRKSDALYAPDNEAALWDYGSYKVQVEIPASRNSYSAKSGSYFQSVQQYPVLSGVTGQSVVVEYPSTPFVGNSSITLDGSNLLDCGLMLGMLRASTSVLPILTTILDACLIDGFGQKSPAGWSRRYSDSSGNRIYRMPAGTQNSLQIQACKETSSLYNLFSTGTVLDVLTPSSESVSLAKFPISPTGVTASYPLLHQVSKYVGTPPASTSFDIEWNLIVSDTGLILYVKEYRSDSPFKSISVLYFGDIEDLSANQGTVLITDTTSSSESGFSKACPPKSVLSNHVISCNWLGEHKVDIGIHGDHSYPGLSYGQSVNANNSHVSRTMPNMQDCSISFGKICVTELPGYLRGFLKGVKAINDDASFYFTGSTNPKLRDGQEILIDNKPHVMLGPVAVDLTSW